jgi:hypothetical protein
LNARVAGVLVASAALAVLAFACADIVGITALPDGATYDAPPYDGPPPPSGACSGSTQILITNDTLSSLGAAGGRIFAQTSTTGIIACSTSAKCSNPQPMFNIAVSDQLESYGLGAQILYTLQGPSGFDAGSLHSIGFDGTGDQALLAKLAYPYWVAPSGSKTFWADDISSVSSKPVPATLHCLGCGSGDAPWITNLNATKAVFADSSRVYVLVDDGSSSFTDGIVACSVNTACGASPQTIVSGGLDTIGKTVVSDGTKVYVARSDVSDLVSIDQNGVPSVIAKNIYVVALVIDVAKGELVFATDGGIIAVVKTDGSSSPTVISSCDTLDYGTIEGLALDATRVYVLMTDFTNGSGVFAIPRP